jgi:predicted DNA-binding transcriptional regulator AlpA
MEAIDFQSGAVIPLPPPPVQEGGFDSLLTDDEAAEFLAVGTDWVRSHAEEIPGFCPLGMYYRFRRAEFQQWIGGSERLLLPEEVAELLKVPKSWVYANADQIPGLLRLGRYVRFRPTTIRAFLCGSEACQ